ncbi:MAG: DUF4097 family beta strand repeat-containing protein [Lachnospiraceae bacterium]
MRIQKTIAAAIALFMALTVLSGCSKDKEYTTATASTDEIQRIVISSEGYPLKIIQGTGNELKITCPDAASAISIDGDTLHVSAPKSESWIVLNTPTAITITLPDKTLQYLEVSSEAGEITASEFQAKEANFSCEGSAVNITGVVGIYSGSMTAGSFDLPNYFEISGSDVFGSFSGTIGNSTNTINISTVTGDITIKIG